LGPSASLPQSLELGPPSAAEALRGLDPRQPIRAIVRTDRGDIPCELDARHAPNAVALFVGLATGRAVWRDPDTGRITRRPLYDNLTFHRAIPRVMVQSGCIVGDGSGYPGYRIPVEPGPDDRARLARPGALTLARYTAPPFRRDPNPPPPGAVLGSQFAITLTDMSHLTGQVTVLGRCENLDVARATARDYRRGHPGARLLRVSVPGAEK
jgi:peptidyl-prolyl cis-trans isomerase A (cyclophilin A)